MTKLWMIWTLSLLVVMTAINYNRIDATGRRLVDMERQVSEMQEHNADLDDLVNEQTRTTEAHNEVLIQVTADIERAYKVCLDRGVCIGEGK